MKTKSSIASAALALALALLLLLLSRRSTLAPPTPAAVPTSSAGTTTARAASTTPSPGHRLAGTVVGDVHYAIIVAPDGTNDLYHVGDEVPGVGKLLEIRARSVIFLLGAQGEFEMLLSAEPTPTAEQSGQHDDSGDFAERDEEAYEPDQLDEADVPATDSENTAVESDDADTEFVDQAGYADEND